MTTPSARPPVGYILKRYPRLSETFVVNEIRALEAAGQPVVIFSLHPPPDGRIPDGVGEIQAEVRYVTASGVKASALWEAFRTALTELEPASAAVPQLAECEPKQAYQALCIASVARRLNVRHLHAHFATSATTVAGAAARLAGIGHSFTAHASDIFRDEVSQSDLGVKIARSAAVVTVSDFNVEHLTSNFPSAARKIRRVYNGLPLDRFPWSRPADRPALLLGIGRLVEKKGFEFLIDACAELRRRGVELRCEIIGEGELGPCLQRRIQERGLVETVSLVGPRSTSEVRERIADAAVVAVPCIVAADGNRDGLPTVLLEAMALGTACVATPVTGIPEVLADGETGLLAEEGSATSLADAIGRLLADPALRCRLSAGARSRIEADFDAHRNIQLHLRLFDGRADEQGQP